MLLQLAAYWYLLVAPGDGCWGRPWGTGCVPWGWGQRSRRLNPVLQSELLLHLKWFAAFLLLFIMFCGMSEQGMLQN